MKLYGGIDLHSNNSVFNLVDEEGQVVLKTILDMPVPVIYAVKMSFKDQLNSSLKKHGYSISQVIAFYLTLRITRNVVIRRQIEKLIVRTKERPEMPGDFQPSNINNRDQIFGHIDASVDSYFDRLPTRSYLIGLGFEKSVPTYGGILEYLTRQAIQLDIQSYVSATSYDRVIKTYFDIGGQRHIARLIPQGKERYSLALSYDSAAFLFPKERDIFDRFDFRVLIDIGRPSYGWHSDHYQVSVSQLLAEYDFLMTGLNIDYFVSWNLISYLAIMKLNLRGCGSSLWECDLSGGVSRKHIYVARRFHVSDLPTWLTASLGSAYSSMSNYETQVESSLLVSGPHSYTPIGLGLRDWRACYDLDDNESFYDVKSMQVASNNFVMSCRYSASNSIDKRVDNYGLSTESLLHDVKPSVRLPNGDLLELISDSGSCSTRETKLFSEPDVHTGFINSLSGVFVHKGRDFYYPVDKSE